MSKTTLIQPYVSEKSYAQSAKRVYVFTIDKNVNKHSVAHAVEAQFDVKVLSVNTTNISGKSKRTISITGKRSVNASGQRRSIKKAYVTLAEGFSLPFFEAIEESSEKEQAMQEKIDKAAEAATKKAAKPARRGILGKKAEA